MQIFISSQEEYDAVVKARKHVGNEIVIQDNKGKEFIDVRTDVTVGKNGRVKVDDKSTVTIKAENNGIVAAEGKSKIIGQDRANIIAKGHCKVELYDEAFSNCYEHCTVTLKNASNTNADGNCTVHAYDESVVSATGSTKVYSYQTATAKGSDISTITARDNCIVYAKENCTVKASDSCLIVANQFAKISAQDNCLVMSNFENPDIKLIGNCEHLKLGEVTDKNIMTALKQMAQSKTVIEKPLVAIQILKENIPPQRQAAVNNRLNMMGLKDQISIKNHLYNLVEAEPAVKNTNTAAPPNFEKQLELAKTTGYVQGVCECVAAVGNEQNMGKKLLTEMSVTKDMAKKFANPETYKNLEKGIFAEKPEQKLERTHSRGL